MVGTKERMPQLSWYFAAFLRGVIMVADGFVSHVCATVTSHNSSRMKPFWLLELSILALNRAQSPTTPVDCGALAPLVCLTGFLSAPQLNLEQGSEFQKKKKGGVVHMPIAKDHIATNSKRQEWAGE